MNSVSPLLSLLVAGAAVAWGAAGRNRARTLSRQLLRVEEAERKRLAQELHDELGQGLTAVKLNLCLTAAGGGRMKDSVAAIDALIARVRALSMGLRPPQLDELGLVPALQSHLQWTARTCGVEIVVDAAPSLPSLGDQAIVAFRVAQGAVTNALRHSDARKIEVRLEPAGSGVRLEVRDQGKGFDPETVRRNRCTFGLFAMQERVRDLGGRFEVRSRPGEGTVVTAEIQSSEG